MMVYLHDEEEEGILEHKRIQHIYRIYTKYWDTLR